MNVGFIGTGDISAAIVTGIVRAELPIDSIAVSARSRSVSSRLSEQYDVVDVFEDNQDVVDAADLVFLAVLPQQAEAVLTPLHFGADQELASLISTVPVEKIAAWTGASGRVTRAIPLPPVAHLRSVTVLSGESRRLEDLFQHLGGVIVAKDMAEFDALTVPNSLMGTFFGLQEIITAWLGEHGVPETDARRFLSGLFLTLAQTGVETDRTFSELRVAHSTPGGLNEQAFRVFSEEGGSDALRKAMDSVIARIGAGSKV